MSFGAAVKINGSPCLARRCLGPALDGSVPVVPPKQPRLKVARLLNKAI